jgi:23S rRNA (uridine2552-2'-O)-methyltransferase
MPSYRRKDSFYRRARAAGYRARSAYKLAELDRRFSLLHRGDAVVDLGAWPGGWLQVTAERIGAGGRVVGLDLVEVEPLAAPNVVVVTGDLRDDAVVDRVCAALARPADVVLSDIAPKLTGVRGTDEARAAELAARTLAVLPRLLRPGGRLLMKTFMNEAYTGLLRRAREVFREVRTTRPEATRRGSSELYVLGTGYRAPAA